MTLLSNILQVVRTVPQVVKYLPPEYKTYEYFLARVEGLVRGVYGGYIGGDFVDILANLIRGQIADAYGQAWQDEGYDPPLPDYLNASMEAFITAQTNFDWIYQYYKDIVDARVDGTPINPLLSRASMWANQWNAAYNEAARIITLETGGNMIWEIGEAEHCSTCLALDGIIASAKEWDESGWRPQSKDLECHGYNCKCSLTYTPRRRSKAMSERLAAVR